MPITNPHASRALFLLAISALLASPSIARAEGDDPDVEVARRHFQAGSGFYNKRDYDHALSEFQAAREIKPLAALDYNIARCFDRMERYPEAVAAYQRFVAEAPNDPDAVDARERARILAERVEARQHKRPVTGDAPSVQRPPLLTPPIVGVSPEPIAQAIRVEAEGTRPGRRLVAPIALGVVGLAALGVGIGLSVDGWSSYDHLKSSCGSQCDPTSYSGLQLRTYLGYGLAGAGVAALVADGVLWFYALRNQRPPATTVSPTLNGFLIRRSF